MRRINRTYFGRNSDTDVIAFPYGDDESEAGGGVLLGDIVVSVHRARVQAREWHTDINREILLYIVHGILHLCGYDDTRPRERKRMEARQDYILKRAFKIRQWNVINL
jgi:rRNA maturation RNase YbeY